MKRYLVIETHTAVDVAVDEILFGFILYDYGGVKEDEAILNESCIALTREVDGGYPFIVMPEKKVRELEK